MNRPGRLIVVSAVLLAVFVAGFFTGLSPAFCADIGGRHFRGFCSVGHADWR